MPSSLSREFQQHPFSRGSTYWTEALGAQLGGQIGAPLDAPFHQRVNTHPIMCWSRGLIEWDRVYDALKPYATFTAGAIFGLGWWVWADALLYSVAVGHHAFRVPTLIPGLVATAAAAMMNTVSRDDVDATYADDGTVMRSKLVLLLSYMTSLGAIGGAISLLVMAQQAGGDLWVGASGILQCCLLLASGMLCYFFHDADSNSSGYGYL